MSRKSLAYKRLHAPWVICQHEDRETKGIRINAHISPHAPTNKILHMKEKWKMSLHSNVIQKKILLIESIQDNTRQTHHNEKPFPTACSFLKCQTHSFEAILWYILLGIGLSYRELAETKIPSLGIFNRVEQKRLERSKIANFVKYCQKTELFQMLSF